MANPNAANLPDSDKPAEYFKIKQALKTLRGDLKDFQTQHANYQKIQKLNKELKQLRDDMNSDEVIKEVKEKIGEQKERMDLLKELIRIQLIENSEEKVTKDGQVLKLVYVLKEVRGEEE